MFNLESFKRFYHRRKELEVDLGDFTIKDLVNFPYMEGAQINVPFIDEFIHVNHLIVRQSSSRRINATHHYEYLPDKKLVIVESYFEHDAYVTYAIVSLAFILLFQNPINLSLFFFVVVSMFFVVSIILFVNFMIDAQEMQRELVIRINYTLRTGRKVNAIS